MEEVVHKFTPYVRGEKPIQGFIIQVKSTPTGYIQTYALRDYPWFGQDFSEAFISQAAGLDLFMGAPEFLGKGMGKVVLKRFLKTHIWPFYKYCVVDPDVRHTHA